MTYSSLVTKTIPHHGKYHSRGGTAISRVIVHHWASTSGGDTSLADPSRNASVNYFVYSDGSVGVQVPEEFRAWTSGGPEADLPSITIEVQNSSTRVFNGPDGRPNHDDPRSWAVSDKALATLAKLIADIALRYKWGSVTRTRVRGHREFSATACPGGFLWHRLSSIAAAANDLLHNKTEEDPMPKSSRITYRPKGGRKITNSWTYLTINDRGDVTVLGSGDKGRHVLAFCNLDVKGVVDVRAVVEQTSADGKKVLRSNVNYYARIDRLGTYSIPLDIPKGYRLRFQARSLDKTPVIVGQMGYVVDYWEK